MPVFQLTDEIVFPPAELAEEEGLLAVGGDLSPERLLLAYRQGIFPWFQEEIPLWWSPDPRFVLFPTELKIRKSMRPILRNPRYSFRINTDFESVIRHCRHSERKEQDGTWITEEMEQAYIRLHHLGFAHSAECYLDGQLAGGLYGIRMGPFFFGESMFSLQPNTSKYVFIHWVRHLQQQGVELIDCQVYTEHLESLGARMIPRREFLQRLRDQFPDLA